jgi:nicotinamidase-related amidase
MDDSKLDFITVINSVLLLVDYQPNMFNGVASGDKTGIQIAAVASAKTASILNVPVIYTSIDPAGNGDFIPELTSIFPKKEVIPRALPNFDAFEDENVLNTIRKSGRKKLIVSGLWTSLSFAYTALHAIREGYEVYGLIDAGGDATLDAHNYGVEQMLLAWVTPITWKPLMSEWMNDWANPYAGAMMKELYRKYDAVLSA